MLLPPGRLLFAGLGQGVRLADFLLVRFPSNVPTFYIELLLLPSVALAVCCAFSVLEIEELGTMSDAFRRSTEEAIRRANKNPATRRYISLLASAYLRCAGAKFCVSCFSRWRGRDKPGNS